eukprot:s1689_g2.t1
MKKKTPRIRTLLIQHNFTAADKDGSGVICQPELALMMRRLNPDMTEKEIDAMHKSMDKDLDGKVNFDEFYNWMLEDAQSYLASKLLDKSSTPAGAISATFRMWDKDGNGKLSRMELAAVLRKAMPEISREHLDSIFEELDGDKSGEVDSAEFVAFLFSNKGSRASLSKAQVERPVGWSEVPDTAAAARAGAKPTVPSLAERTPPRVASKPRR